MANNAQTYKLTLSYDGTRYSGWQRQGNTGNTIQAKLESALSQVLGAAVEVSGSGRTDAGVHARGQVVSFRADTKLDCPELLRRLRAALPEDIGALALEIAEPRFHARLSCTGKTYVYRVWNSQVPNVFERRYLLVLPEALDLNAMTLAADQLRGRRDFRAFCGNPHMKKSTVRTLESIQIQRIGEELRFIFSGDGFLYNMVRLLMGALLEVGRGNLEPEQMDAILEGERPVPPMAPAKGLCLWEVRYGAKEKR